MEVPEFHQTGSLGISNQNLVLQALHDAWEADTEVDVGLQVGADGRIWVCVNGQAFLRFKPRMKQMYTDAPERESPVSHP